MFRELFLPHLREVGAVDMERLEQTLDELFESAKSANPRITLAADTYLRFLAEHIEPGVELFSALSQLRTEVLYLTCACAGGDNEAIATFERRYFSTVDPAIKRLGGPAALLDEAKQALRERLFAPTAARPPRIAEYGGRAEPASWLRAVATRLAIDLLRSGGKEIATPDEVLVERALPGDDLELAVLKERYRADFKAAVREAINTLTAAERNDLRLYYVDGLDLQQIASLFHVSPSTISRRLSRARAAVLDSTKRLMRESLGVGEADVESILRLISSRLELSIGALKED